MLSNLAQLAGYTSARAVPSPPIPRSQEGPRQTEGAGLQPTALFDAAAARGALSQTLFLREFSPSAGHL